MFTLPHVRDGVYPPRATILCNGSLTHATKPSMGFMSQVNLAASAEGIRLDMTKPHYRHTHSFLARLLALLSLLMAVLLTSSPRSADAQAPAPSTTAMPVKPLVTFPVEAIEITEWMTQQQWKSKRHNPRRFEVGKRRLRLVSQDDSIMIGTTHGLPIDPHAWPRLRLRLRVTKTPTRTDNAKKSGDDAAFRVYVAFDRGKGLFGPPHTVVYVWTENVEAETLIPSPYFRKKLRYLSIGRGVTVTPGYETQRAKARAPRGDGRQDDTGWVTIERDLLRDYRLAFPTDTQPVPMVGGIMLKCDSNNTGTSAEAWLATLELLPPAK